MIFKALPLRKIQSCEELIWRYKKVVRHFKINYEESTESNIVKEHSADFDAALRKVLICLPEEMKSIEVPIYFLKNASLVTGEINRFKNLEMLHLSGSGGYKVSTFKY